MGITNEQLPEFGHLTLPNEDNIQGLTLNDVAHLTRTDGAVSISREQGQRLSVVLVNVGQRDLSGFVTEAKQALTDLSLPQGYYMQFGG
jgi:cobalt-zinc-cadmium resistance protein CzcA